MIDALFDRNIAWALGKTRADPGYFRRLAQQQSPSFLWIGCSDSRVPANEIVGLDPGELFVHRNIANVVHTGDLNLLSVLDFAVGALRVAHVIVCGHYGCGGVRRALQGGEGGLVDHWLAPVADIHLRQRERFDPIETEEAKVNLLCELNVEAQVGRIARTPIVRSAWEQGRDLAVHGWIYGLKDGLIRDLGVTRDRLTREPQSAGAQPVIDPAPVDDWSSHMRHNALRLLRAKPADSSCDCGLDKAPARFMSEAAE